MCSVWPSVSHHRHSGKQRRTNELTVTPNHLCTSTLFVPPAYLIKIRAKVMFNKSPVVHLHSQQAGANKRSALMAHASLLLNWQFSSFLLPSPNWACMWCDIKKESITDLCHYGCSRLSIQSCFCPLMCWTAKGRTQLFSCCNVFLVSIKCEPYSYQPILILWVSECHLGCWRWWRPRCTGRQCGNWGWRSTGHHRLCCSGPDWSQIHWSSLPQYCHTLRV